MHTKLLKASEVAAILKIATSQAKLLMKVGDLKTVKDGRTLRVREEDLEHFIQKNCSLFPLEKAASSEE